MATMPETVTVSLERTGAGARLVERLRSLVGRLDGQGVREGARWWLVLRVALGLDTLDAIENDEDALIVEDARGAAVLVDDLVGRMAVAPEATTVLPSPTSAGEPREHEAHRPERLKGLTRNQRCVFEAVRRGDPIPRYTRPATLDALVRAGLLKIVPVNRFAYRHQLAVDDAADRAWAWNRSHGIGCAITVWFKGDGRPGVSNGREGRIESPARVEGGVAVADVQVDGEAITVELSRLGPLGWLAFRRDAA